MEGARRVHGDEEGTTKEVSTTSRQRLNNKSSNGSNRHAKLSSSIYTYDRPNVVNGREGPVGRPETQPNKERPTAF